MIEADCIDCDASIDEERPWSVLFSLSIPPTVLICASWDVTCALSSGLSGSWFFICVTRSFRKRSCISVPPARPFALEGGAAFVAACAALAAGAAAAVALLEELVRLLRALIALKPAPIACNTGSMCCPIGRFEAFSGGASSRCS
jgi:hypothetical protein